MGKKQRERYKDRAKGEKPEAEAKPVLTSEALRKRRNRRFLFLGVIALSFPLVEVIAYRFRAITITLSNRSDEPITGIKLVYPGGEIETPELKPGGSITRVVRPDFTFNNKEFATYRLTVQFMTVGGVLIRQTGRVGSIDFSAHEQYTFQTGVPNEPIPLKHTTSPGFPLSTIRDLLQRMGIG